MAGPELMLPRGFRYVLFGAAGSRMSDGYLTPSAHDGMSCFPLGLSRSGPMGASEFAGAFSLDGQWLFVNVQYPGLTVAITGPWNRGCL
ncbi:MAG TPA: hypothetical protein VGL13_10980 [Polyangiaceae bacterium]